MSINILERGICRPGVSHRTFGFRTQSKSFVRLSPMAFGHRTKSNSQKKFKSNKIERSTFELNRTKEFDWVRLSLAFERNQTHTQTKSNVRFSNSWWQVRGNKLRWPMGVTAQTKTSRHKQILHGTNKYFMAQTNTSRHEQNISQHKQKLTAQTKSLTARHKQNLWRHKRIKTLTAQTKTPTAEVIFTVEVNLTWICRTGSILT